MKGIVLIRDLLYLYTILFFCDWLALKKKHQRVTLYHLSRS